MGVAEKSVQNGISAKAIEAGLTPDDIEPQLTQAEIGPENGEILAELAPLIMEEWGLDPQVSPTACAALILLPWAVSSAAAYIAIADLAKERRAMLKKATPAESQEAPS